MSKSQDLEQLRKLASDLKKAEACRNDIASLENSIVDTNEYATAGVDRNEEDALTAVNRTVSDSRRKVRKFIQVIFTLLMLAVSVYSFLQFIPAMQSRNVEVGLYVFFGIVHGAVCLTVTFLSVGLASAMSR